MLKKSLTISLTDPCTRSLDEMEPVEQGWHCAHCQKMVIDFTNVTDKEILEIFRSGKMTNGCGRFNYDQLNRPITRIETSRLSGSSFLSKIAASIIIFQSVITNVWAQKVKPITYQLAQNKTKKKQLPNSRKLIGCIIDIETDERLSDMLVQIEGTNIKAISQEKTGYYELILPDTLVQSQLKLTVCYTKNSVDFRQGTDIPDVEVELKSTSIADIYRYSEHRNNDVIAFTYKRPLISESVAGGYIIVEDCPRRTSKVHTLFRKLFRRKDAK